MPMLRCSQKLTKLIGKNAGKIFSTGREEVGEPILGDWTAHLITFARKKFVLFINDKTLLTLLTFYAPKEYLQERFQQALFKELLRLDVFPDNAAEESDKYRNFSVGKNTDRSMSGYINRLSMEYKYYILYHLEECGVFDIMHAQSLANSSCHLQRKNSFPENYVRELFGVPIPKHIPRFQ